MIALYRGRGVISRLIQAQTAGPYSHAAWLCADGRVIEAHAGVGVVVSPTPFTRNGGSVLDLYAVNGLTARAAEAVESWMLERVGRGYDYVAIARFLSRINRNNEERWFCSELVAEGLEAVGRPVLRREPWRISPTAMSWSMEITPMATDLTAGVWSHYWEVMSAA